MGVVPCLPILVGVVSSSPSAVGTDTSNKTPVATNVDGYKFDSDDCDQSDWVMMMVINENTEMKATTAITATKAMVVMTTRMATTAMTMVMMEMKATTAMTGTKTMMVMATRTVSTAMMQLTM